MTLGKKEWTLAGIGAVVAAVLTSLTLVVNWALETDAKIGESNHQRMALVQADSALFLRDSLKEVRLAKLEKRAGIKTRRVSRPPPPPPKREGVLKRIWGLFW